MRRIAAASMAAIAAFTLALEASASPSLVYGEDPGVAAACTKLVSNTPFNHVDAAVADGDWGLCTYSDRVDRITPGSEPVAEAIFYRVASEWEYTRRHTSGHYDLPGLTFFHVPYPVAQRLLAKRTLVLNV